MQKYSVHVDGFINEFQTFEPGVACCIRHQSWEGSEWLQTDVSGNFWAFAVFDVEPGNFFFLQEDQRISVDRKTAFYLHPMSVFSTITLKGQLSWRAYFSFKKPPADFPDEPTVMQWDSGTSVNSTASLWPEILNQRSTWKRVGTPGIPSLLATKTKRTIDSTFTEKLSIHEICRELGYSHEVVDRAFKRRYGITPQHYRRKLRTAEALALMVLKGINVSRAGLDVSYSDIDNFSKQFRKTFAGMPSQFRPPKGFSEVSI